MLITNYGGDQDQLCRCRYYEMIECVHEQWLKKNDDHLSVFETLPTAIDSSISIGLVLKLDESLE